MTKTAELASAGRAERHVVRALERVSLPRLPGMSRADDRAFRVRDVDWLPEDVVMTVDDAVVVGRNGWVLVDGALVTDLWAEEGFPSERMSARQLGAGDVVRVAGRTASLATPWLPNYYHWLLQAVPRIALVREVVQEADIDHWLVPVGGTYVDEWCDLMGIEPGKRVPVTTATRVEAEHLVVSSVPARNRHVPSWVVELLRASVPIEDTGVRRVFLDRPESDKRRIVNRGAVLDAVSAAGFDVVRTDGASVRQQASAFASADVVVGVLGAGLVNAVHQRPGTVLVELMPRNLVFPSYYKLSRAAGLDYRYLVGDEPVLPWPLRYPDNQADLHVPVDQLVDVLASLP